MSDETVPKGSGIGWFELVVCMVVAIVVGVWGGKTWALSELGPRLTLSDVAAHQLFDHNVRIIDSYRLNKDRGDLNRTQVAKLANQFADQWASHGGIVLFGTQVLKAPDSLYVSMDQLAKGGR